MTTPLAGRFACHSGFYCAALLVGIALLSAAPSAFGGPADDQAFHALRGVMRKWVREYDVPAASAAIMSGDMRIRKLHYGSMLATDPARIASLSKAITAICVARIIDDGRVSLTSRVGPILAQAFAKLGEPVDPRFKSVTIEQLITHRAGFAREATRRLKAGDMQAGFKSALATPLASDPGGGYSYSNLGYLTLGMIIEAVSGRNYEEQCRRTALEPLGATGSIDPQLRHRTPNGGWRVSAVDYLKFMQVWNPHSDVLGPISRRWLASRTGKGAYGLGMRMDRSAHGTRFSHGGRVALRERGGSYAIKFEDGMTVVAVFEGNLDRKGRGALPRSIRSAFSQD